MSTDKVTEKQMAEYLGTTYRALQAKRYRNQIPEGIYNIIGRTIYYSIKRYEEWRESQWKCQLELNSGMVQSGSGSPGMAQDVLKPSRIQQTKRGLHKQAVYVIR